MRFIPNLERKTCRRNESLAVGSIDVDFDLVVENYLLWIKADVKYVEGRGGRVVNLNNAALTGGFSLWSATYHWARRTAAGVDQYWDGSNWQNIPAGWG